MGAPSAFAPGEYVGVSGVYGVSHANGPHHEPHRVYCRRGERFPTCVQCGKQVIYELNEPLPMAAEHRLLEDWPERRHAEDSGELPRHRIDRAGRPRR